MVRDGYFYGAGFLAVAVVVALLTGCWAWAVLPVLLAAFFLWFFRDPERTAPTGAGLVVSPADGKVTEVVRIQTPDGERQRISIFLNVFNVHVNRAPMAGVLSGVTYKKGKYLNAMNPASAEENEQTIVTITGDDGVVVTFKLIAGLLARRIVFQKAQGDRVERGQRVAVIKFGSRSDVILPAEAAIVVKVGDKVAGATSILARLAGGDQA